MSFDFKKNDLLLNLNNSHIGKVVEVNNYWGWMRVEYAEATKIYTLNNQSVPYLVVMGPEQRADYYLQLEESGITNSWSES